MQFVAVTITNVYLLDRFLRRAGSSLVTFRYFATRPFSTVQNHVCTWVIEDRGEVEAYGHLDREGETVWLGIAVTCHVRGKGFGRAMMDRLMASARALGVTAVRLSVDNANEVAIRLYERFGFRLLVRGKTSSFFEWRSASPKGTNHLSGSTE